MNKAKTPRSLRANAAVNSASEKSEIHAGKVTAVAGLMAVASFSGAEAQQSNLPPVTVDAPVSRPRPTVSRPTPDQIRARNALRRAARRSQPTQAAPVPFPNAGTLSPDRNPYADAAAPYKVDHLQSSSKFPEPLVNTPRTVTVLSKEVLADEHATNLKEAVLNQAGVTLGTGEGGNAFGDRFFVRGFDVRNDIFIDGVRDTGVSVRENFFTEQIEILRGPGSSFAGRGTTGGAINIVTKQATTEKSFYNMDEEVNTNPGERVTLDVNQVISPTFAMRAGGVFQKSDIEGRNFATDNRTGGFLATTWKPIDGVKITTDYIHSETNSLPDFGVPYFRPGATGSSSQMIASMAGGPYPDYNVNRNNFYGFVNRDFYKTRQDIGTLNAEVQITPDLTLTNKTRASESVLNYVGTIPESGSTLTGFYTANAVSRYQPTDVTDNQTEATYKFDTWNWKHTAVAGVEFSRELSSIDSYTGLSSEGLGAGAVSSSGAPTTVSIVNPQFTFLSFPGSPSLTGLPTRFSVDTKSGYLMDSANYRDLVILNGGVRLDDYSIKVGGFGTSNGVPNSYGAQAGHFDMPNFNLGIALKPLPITTVYASYATSSDPVGSEFDGTSTNYGGISPVINSNSNQILGPTQNSAIEIGNKWELFEKHLLVSGAWFQTNVTNARESFNVTSAANQTAACPYVPSNTSSQPCISGGAAYEIHGFDFEVAGKITDKWSMFGGLVLMKSAVTKSLVLPANTALYTTNVGLPLANVANQSFSLLNTYKINDTWEVGGTAVYRSKILGGTLLAANQGTSLPSYWRFDTFAEAKIDKNWKVKVYAQNLFNKLYYQALYQSNLPFVLEAPGRTVGIVIMARY